MNKYSVSLSPVKSVHSSNNKIYSKEEMKEMIDFYNYFGRMKGGSIIGYGQIYNARDSINNDLSKLSHKITKLSISEDETIDVEIETITSKGYQKHNILSTDGDKTDFLLKQHMPHNIVFVIENIDGVDNIVSIDIEFEY